jgi:ribonuclease HI
MKVSTPRYLLLVETGRHGDSGGWRFSLRTCEGQQLQEHIEASDREPEIRGERLELLTVVRALEALDQPSHVTLLGCSQYIRNGLQYGLPEWQSNGWRWEFFGQMLPVKNGDLWQRVDRTLRFHKVECRQRRIDAQHRTPNPLHRPNAEGRRQCGAGGGQDARQSRRTADGSGQCVHAPESVSMVPPRTCADALPPVRSAADCGSLAAPVALA